MKKTSIIILSYNTYAYTKLCIESIRCFTKPGTYEIIVVDNASTDESISWLKKQRDIRTIYNKKNEGFPKGCNQGMDIASGSEILLLNSDTIVTPSWLDNLLRALYSDEKIGAVGCVTNSCSNFQQIPVKYTSIEDMFAFAKQYNHSNQRQWQESLTLVGFCFLLKRVIYETIGFLDEQFSPGNYEDDDYSLRIWQAGYRLLLCKDTFIHHFGSASFVKSISPELEKEKQKKYNALLQKNFMYFKHKWGVSDNYKQVHPLLLGFSAKVESGMRIAMIDCGSGLDLFVLSAKYPQAEISGIALREKDAVIAGQAFPVCFCRDIEKEIFHCLSGKYNFILFTAAVSGLFTRTDFVENIKGFLSLQGKIYWEQDGNLAEIQADSICRDKDSSDFKLEIFNEEGRKIYADQEEKCLVLTLGKASFCAEGDINPSGFGCHVLVGGYCSLGSNILFGVDNGPLTGDIATYNFKDNYKDECKKFSAYEQILIGNDVWIGNDVKIAKGIRIGNGVIVRPGAFITEDVPAYAVVAGNPARVVTYRFREEDIYRLQWIKWWNWPYDTLKTAIPFMKDVDQFIATFYREETVQEVTETAQTLKALHQNGYCIYGFIPDFGISSAIWENVIQKYLEGDIHINKMAMVLEIPSKDEFPLEYEQLCSLVESRGDDAPLVLIHEGMKSVALDIVQNIDCFLTSREDVTSRYIDYADGYGIRVISGLKKDIFSK